MGLPYNRQNSTPPWDNFRTDLLRGFSRDMTRPRRFPISRGSSGVESGRVKPRGVANFTGRFGLGRQLLFNLTGRIGPPRPVRPSNPTRERNLSDNSNTRAAPTSENRGLGIDSSRCFYHGSHRSEYVALPNVEQKCSSKFVRRGVVSRALCTSYQFVHRYGLRTKKYGQPP